MQPIDLESLSPVQRMELADVLYDSAVAELESQPFTPEELAEIDRRLAQLDSGTATLVSWEQVRAELMLRYA